jgi:hypothetical protein
MRAVLCVTLTLIVAAAGALFARQLPPRLTFPTDLDDFYEIVAMNFNVPALCERIDPRTEGDSGFDSPRGFQVETMRSRCFRELAAALHDPKLCDKVEPVSAGRLDGSKFDKAHCLENVGGHPQGIYVPDPHIMAPFIGFLGRLGYGEREVVESKYDENPEISPTFDALGLLLKDQGFLQRVRAGRTYGEPRDQAHVRAANPAEYLYQIVAITGNDPTLCGKVSPNATMVDFGGKTALLRSRCFVALAYNRREARFCDELPASNTFPNVNPNYDSLEACRSTVEIYQRPTFHSNLHDGPWPFPHAADFEPALQAIGYALEYTRTLVAKPGANEYWEFVSRLKYRGTPNDRAEFVRRVLALDDRHP